MLPNEKGMGFETDFELYLYQSSSEELKIGEIIKVRIDKSGSAFKAVAERI